MICIRDAREDELPFVHALNESGVPHVGSLRREDLEQLVVMSVWFRIAELDATPVGFLIALPPGIDYGSPNYRYFSREFDDFLYVDRIITDARARRKGVARALYEDLEAFAGRIGHPRICAEVNVRPRNEESLLFHQRMGFREVGQQDTEQGEKRVSLLVRSLTTRRRR